MGRGRNKLGSCKCSVMHTNTIFTHEISEPKEVLVGTWACQIYIYTYIKQCPLHRYGSAPDMSLLSVAIVTEMITVQIGSKQTHKNGRTVINDRER